MTERWLRSLLFAFGVAVRTDAFGIVMNEKRLVTMESTTQTPDTDVCTKTLSTKHVILLEIKTHRFDLRQQIHIYELCFMALKWQVIK